MTSADLNLKTGIFRFAQPPNKLALESEQTLGPIDIAWESYGHLNAAKDNAILICHALTGDAHAAGRYQSNDHRPGWWDTLIGPAKPLDTNRYFIVCSNILGGCSGSTGPSSINPATNEPYGMSFPTITINDMVESQYRLVRDGFKIERLVTIIGGSIGGMQVLTWAMRYPDMMRSIIPISTTYTLSPQAIAFNKIGRRAIMLDPKWNNGNYYKDMPELDGLALARMVAHITYLSEEGMRQKFGRYARDNKNIFRLDDNFEVEHYLDHQGYSFIKRFDANSYIYLSKAMDIYDVRRDYDSLEKALRRIKAKALTVTFNSDWLFPPYQTEEVVAIMSDLGQDVIYHKLESQKGHDAFLVEHKLINPLIDKFLDDLR